MTSDRRMLDPTKKIYPMSKGRGEAPVRWSEGVNLHLKSNLIPTRDAGRAETKPCVHQETPQRLSQTCLLVLESLL